LKLSEAGELALLRELERLHLVSGQDAEGAILADGYVATADLLIEGIHFRLEWTSFRDLGYKAAAVNLSDLAAMGAVPAGLLVGLGVVVVLLTLAVWLVDLPTGVLSAGVLLGAVAVLAAAVLLTRRTTVVRLDETGYRVRLVRGAGATEARWTDVEDVVTATVSGEDTCTM